MEDLDAAAGRVEAEFCSRAGIQFHGKSPPQTLGGDPFAPGASVASMASMS
jgi:hypothetical protein